jgi:hypothetical protein
MAINTIRESSSYLETAKRSSRIARVFERQDVRRAMAQHPDADSCWCSLCGYTDKVTINVNINVGEDPRVAEIATMLSSEEYEAREEYVALDNRYVALRVFVRATAPLDSEDKALLRSLGKVKVRTEEYISCDA